MEFAVHDGSQVGRSGAALGRHPSLERLPTERRGAHHCVTKQNNQHSRGSGRVRARQRVGSCCEWDCVH